MSGGGQSSGVVTIQRLVALEAERFAPQPLLAGVNRIFRATAVRWPTDTAASAAFQHLWLDQYLEHERDLVFVASRAQAGGGRDVVGYLLGCRINPARSPRFAALDYFQAFAPLCARYPAHLHVNIDAGCRGQRIGERLVEVLCELLAFEGLAGVHVVTGREQRNVGFYRRLGFDELGHVPRGATEVLFLGRRLARTAPRS